MRTNWRIGDLVYDANGGYPIETNVGKVKSIVGPYLPEPGTNVVIVRWSRLKRGVKGAKETTEVSHHLLDFKRLHKETLQRAAALAKLMMKAKLRL